MVCGILGRVPEEMHEFLGGYFGRVLEETHECLVTFFDDFLKTRVRVSRRCFWRVPEKTHDFAGARSRRNARVPYGIFRRFIEEMRMSTFQVILSSRRVHVLKVSHFSFITSHFGQLVCFRFPDQQGETDNSSPADTLPSEDMTRETLNVSKIIS